MVKTSIFGAGPRRRILTAAAVLLGGAAVGPMAAFSQNGGLEAIFAEQSFDGLDGISLPPSAIIAVPAPVGKAATLAAKTQDQEDAPLTPPGLWERSAPLTQEETAFLQARLPQVPSVFVRRMSLADADAVFAQAVSRRYSLLQLFSNQSWKQGDVYYVEGNDVATILHKYKTSCLVPATGRTTDGEPYRIQALVAGEGRVFMLLDRNNFRYKNPSFPGNTFIADSDVVWTIEGPADLGVSGLRVAYTAFIFTINPVIERIAQISPTVDRVYTNHGNRDAKSSPIILRSDFSGKIAVESLFAGKNGLPDAVPAGLP